MFRRALEKILVSVLLITAFAISGQLFAGLSDEAQECEACHSPDHTNGFFAQADKAVNLYNEAYYKPALNMLNELKEKKLLRDNPWTDPFQVKYYFLWHHEGRRARMGATHGAPDYAHWHGFFELMQDLYELEKIYNKRISSGEIED